MEGKERESECGEAGFKFPQIIGQGFGNPFWDYRDPCGPGSLMARYQTELLLDNRQISLFMYRASSRFRSPPFLFQSRTQLTRVKRALSATLIRVRDRCPSTDKVVCIFTRRRRFLLANGNSSF